MVWLSCVFDGYVTSPHDCGVELEEAGKMVTVRMGRLRRLRLLVGVLRAGGMGRANSWFVWRCK